MFTIEEMDAQISTGANAYCLLSCLPTIVYSYPSRSMTHNTFFLSQAAFGNGACCITATETLTVTNGMPGFDARWSQVSERNAHRYLEGPTV